MKEGLELSHLLFGLIGALCLVILFIWKTGQSEAKKDSKVESSLVMQDREIRYLKGSKKRMKEDIEKLNQKIEEKAVKNNELIQTQGTQLENKIAAVKDDFDKKIIKQEETFNKQIEKIQKTLENTESKVDDVLIVMRVIESKFEDKLPTKPTTRKKA